MPTVEILSDAADEAEAAIDWYEREQPGLGDQFLYALNAALDLLQEGLVNGMALAGSLGKRGVRRLVLRRFPYDIVFVSAADRITVLAFAHHSRRPGYWRSRLKPGTGP